MPDISATERGKRYFQMMKEKQAEKVIARIQKQLGPAWQHLSLDETRVLKFLLGEVWVYLDQKAWEGHNFSGVSLQDVLELVATGRSLLKHEMDGRTAAARAERILKKGPAGVENDRRSGEPERER